MNGIFLCANPFSIRLVLALVVGVIAAQQFTSIPPVPVIVLGLAASVLLWLVRVRPPAAFLFGLVYALGFALVRLHDALPPDLERRDLVVEGEVLTVPDEIDSEGLRFAFHADAVLTPENATLPGQLRLSWFKGAPKVKAGERWRLRIRLKRPHGFSNPGGMDYELWLFSQNIRAVGYVRDDADNRKLADAPPLSVQAWRQAVFERLTQALAGHDMAGIVIALTMGAEHAISQAQWDVLRRTGTAHLVAISGSHISLVAGLVYFLVRRTGAAAGLMRWPPHRVAAIAAFIAAYLYSALADFGIPTQRAVVMVFVSMAAIVSQRHLRPWHTLALALLAVVLYDPLAVLAVGFWLSFGAVALILLAVSGRLRMGGWWAGFFKTNWAIFVGLAPLLAFFFQQVSVVSPLANAIAVPTIGVILTPLCLLGALLLGIYAPAGEFLLLVAETALQGIWWVLQALSDWRWAQWQHPAPPGWTLPFALAGAVLLLAPKGIPARWLGLLLLLPALAARPQAPAFGYYRLTLLDVGQGLSTVVQTEAHSLVFDTGPRFGKSFDAGSAVVEPFLRQQGIADIDLLVVSHGDNDHIGGAASLLKHFPIAQTYTSVPALLPSAQACHAGQRWQWDGVEFEMLSPFGTLGNENNNSCVLRIRSLSGSALLTGDIERAAEQHLVEQYGAGLKADILIAPHHGSNTSSTAAFLAQVRPAYVLIPLGYLNRFNFPHPEVLRHYQAIGATVLDSANAGAIRVEPGAPPSSHRQATGKYWNAKGANQHLP